MSDSVLKYKIKGNESFAIREGWLAKGLAAIEEDKCIFSDKNAMDSLGVGSKMVKSIKYWLLASHLVAEKREKNSKHSLVLTDDLGVVVKEFDPYFEDVFTLWIIHYHISSDLSFNTVWNLFFNRFHVTDFTKRSMVDRIDDECQKIFAPENSLYNAIESDCGVILKMYAYSDGIAADPEDNLISPFVELGLISRGAERGSYMKTRPLPSKLDRLAVLYVLVSNMIGDKKSVDIDTLVNQENNIGRIFQLDRNMINEYLDRLRGEGYIEINRTAGLDMVYLAANVTPGDVLRNYYMQTKAEV